MGEKSTSDEGADTANRDDQAPASEAHVSHGRLFRHPVPGSSLVGVDPVGDVEEGKHGTTLAWFGWRPTGLDSLVLPGFLPYSHFYDR